MIEAIIIMLVGQSCGYIDYYMAHTNSTDLIWTCDTTTEDWKLSHLRYMWLQQHFKGVVYVTDSLQCVNDICAGVAFVDKGYGYAWRYLGYIEHEAKHLSCKCDFHPEQTERDYALLEAMAKTR